MSTQLQELKIKELKNMFFYTFGIVPLDSYKVIGDGYTDNTSAIQQAIYDTESVGGKYIFVSRGEYHHRGELKDAENIIFIGNNIDTKIEGIEIRSFPDMWNENAPVATVPIGGKIEYLGVEIPEGYLALDGSTINKTDYPLLFSALGIDTDTYVLPNASGFIVRSK